MLTTKSLTQNFPERTWWSFRFLSLRRNQMRNCGAFVRWSFTQRMVQAIFDKLSSDFSMSKTIQKAIKCRTMICWLSTVSMNAQFGIFQSIWRFDLIILMIQHCNCRMFHRLSNDNSFINVLTFSTIRRNIPKLQIKSEQISVLLCRWFYSNFKAKMKVFQSLQKSMLALGVQPPAQKTTFNVISIVPFLFFARYILFAPFGADTFNEYAEAWYGGLSSALTGINLLIFILKMRKFFDLISNFESIIQQRKWFELRIGLTRSFFLLFSQTFVKISILLQVKRIQHQSIFMKKQMKTSKNAPTSFMLH